MRDMPPLLALLMASVVAAGSARAETPIDFNLDIRSILSNRCFACHGPDESNRQGGLRLDVREGAMAEADSGERAVVPGEPEESELIARVMSDDEYVRMPPPDTGKALSDREKQLLSQWIRQGAAYAQHWSYVKPQRPPLPDLDAALARAGQSDANRWKTWPRNGIDHFILHRLLDESMQPSPEADRYALIRRVALDLTGLPPTMDEVDRFVNDPDPDAYERLVDRLLDQPGYGEHWARMWLDLARYADSAGYADDPPRTIWAYRDWVIRALNANLPFDQFTVDQLAGDLLAEPTEDQLIATAFHRNTMTNNEGGTNDEEFRNVAVIDRVNTTMAVWMGTTIDCAQCHSHKYDPISQEEYFRLFAILNNTEDADRRDESPLVPLMTDEQKQQKEAWESEAAALESLLATPTPPLLASQQRWEQSLARELVWQPLRPRETSSRENAAISLDEDGTVHVAAGGKTDVYRIALPLGPASAGADSNRVTAIRLETLPHESLPGQGTGYGGGNFVITRITAALQPSQQTQPVGRFVRIEIPGQQKMLSLAEVQVFSGGTNIAIAGEATQSSTDFDGPARLAIDGKTDGNYEAGSVTHTAVSDDPWWEVDLKTAQPIDRVVVFNRTDGDTGARLNGFRLAVLDEQRQPIWETTVAEAPKTSREFSVSNLREIPLAAAFADYAQAGFDAANVLDAQDSAKKGWAIGGQTETPHHLTLVPAEPFEAPEGAVLQVTIEQLSQHESHTLGRFRLAVSRDPRVAEFARTPPAMLAIVRMAVEARSDEQQTELTRFYISQVAPELQDQRQRLAVLRQQLADLKPATSVPVMREVPEDRRRRTFVQLRGNFLDLGAEVTAGLPATFPAPPADQPLNRLTLARWLVDDDNPLTARVVANRYWEALFGRGIVATSEEFGSQGDLPTHPELLDWLATELVRLGWDRKAFLRLLVTSATYRQSSRVSDDLLQHDPDNRWLARGPRFRMSAEMVRDQALDVGGLLSSKMYGPPVNPPQPALGLSAAFGSGIDWKTSAGEDRYRRGLYTSWRRSNPYPSMTAFDAPSREVCTIRRDRTNTPLQALVTLNDPVYVEAAQGLARRMTAAGSEAAGRAAHGFRVCVARPPSEAELEQLVDLYERARQAFDSDAEAARKMATVPLGPAADGADLADLAAWTVVANVLLNLDEVLMKR